MNKSITIPSDLWSSILLALEQCVEQLQSVGNRTRREEVRKYAQQALKAARPERITH